LFGATRSLALPAPEELVPNTVARVSNVPSGAGTVTKAEFRHALVVTAAEKGRRTAPRLGGRGYARLMRIAVNGLLEAIWLKGQAAEMNIVVTPGQVSRLLAQLKKQNFKNATEYRAFLKEARLTRRDVFERVELELLVTRLQQRILAGVRSVSEERKAISSSPKARSGAGPTQRPARRGA
jgi:hypothetical protein